MCPLRSSVPILISLFIFFLLFPAQDPAMASLNLRGRASCVAQVTRFMTSQACLQTSSNSHFPIHLVPNYSPSPSPGIHSTFCLNALPFCLPHLPKLCQRPSWRKSALLTRLPRQPPPPLLCAPPTPSRPHRFIHLSTPTTHHERHRLRLHGDNR